jgi:segregation and condensation protein A
MGITVTFVAILELVREGLIDIVQAEPFAPLHVRAASGNRTLRVVSDNEAPAAGGDAGSEPAGESVFAAEREPVAVLSEPASPSPSPGEESDE